MTCRRQSISLKRAFQALVPDAVGVCKMQVGKLEINRLLFTTYGIAALPDFFYTIHQLKQNSKHSYRKEYKMYITSHHLPLLFPGGLITAVQQKTIQKAMAKGNHKPCQLNKKTCVTETSKLYQYFSLPLHIRITDRVNVVRTQVGQKKNLMT